MELLSLNDFKFMQGLQAARSFLVQLKATKELSELRINHKNPSSNSLQFSPIARRQSQLGEQSSSDEASRRHKRSPSMEQYQHTESEFQRVASREQSIGIPQVQPIEDSKNNINRIVAQLANAYNELKISEAAVEVLRQRLESKRDVYREIERLKNEEREKHFKILSLKNSIIRKRERLAQRRLIREKFRTVVAGYIRDYMKSSEVDEDIILIFAPDLLIEQTFYMKYEPTVERYPEQLTLKYPKIKKREKKKPYPPVTTSMPMIAEPVIAVDAATTFFGKEKKNKSFASYDAYMESYCDDSL